MKFAKKVLVGIVAVAMLVCCFAFSASAEAPVLPVEKLSDVFEYLWYDTYLIEDYEGQESEEYKFVSSNYADEEKTVPYFTYLSGDAATKSGVVSEGDNKYLSISNKSQKEVGYKMYFEEGGYKYFVTSFDFKTGDSGADNGSDFVVKATLRDYFDDITLFAANASKDGADAKEFAYSEYNSDRVTYDTVKATAVPELGVWYHVDIVFSPEGEKYSVTVTKGEETVFTFEDTIDKSVEGIDSIRIYVSDSEDAGETTTCIDNLVAYEGTSMRDVVNSGETLAKLALDIDVYAKHEATSLENKIAVADFYAQFYEGKDYGISYTAPEGVENYEALVAIKAGEKAFRNQTYVLALTTYVESAAEVEGYYAKKDYLEDYASRYYDMFKSVEDLSQLEGVDAEAVKTITNALDAYDDILDELDKIKQYSEAFVKAIEGSYDSRNKNFEVMKANYSSLTAMIGKVDSDYKYSEIEGNEESKYPTVADAIAVYLELEAKIDEISASAEKFISAVAKMDNTQADSVSKESPWLTNNFSVLYDEYQTASSVYSNGTVHASLDPTTYPGLTDAIAEYLEYEAYIQARIDECNIFIAAINGANSSSYYRTVLSQLEVAGEYLDNNKEKSLEIYGEVNDDGKTAIELAVDKYDELVKKLEDSEKAADAYIAAVNAIDLDASYLELKAAVANARALKASGSVIGYSGVAAADEAFAKADAKLAAFDGHSATLITVVESLKDADTLAKRRELIFIAINAREGAQDNVSGVTAAKTELENYIKKYNEDVARVNALFAEVVGDSGSSISSFAPVDAVVKSAEAVGALVK